MRRRDVLSRRFWRQGPNVGARGPCAEGPGAPSITAPARAIADQYLLPLQADPQPVARQARPPRPPRAQSGRRLLHASGCTWPLCDVSPADFGGLTAPARTHLPHRWGPGARVLLPDSGEPLVMLPLAGTSICPHGGVRLSPRGTLVTPSTLTRDLSMHLPLPADASMALSSRGPPTPCAQVGAQWL